MIWYLTYPFRRLTTMILIYLFYRTVTPPILKPGHPIRDGVERYAQNVSANPASVILVSITIGLVTCFLSFLSHASGSISGALALPGHMYTSTRALDYALPRTPDFVVKQAWIHGPPMRALERNVLKETLIIQQHLLGLCNGTLATIAWNGSNSTMEALVKAPPPETPTSKKTPIPSAGPLFHSPLQYWNNSLVGLEADSNIPDTINAKSSDKSPFNITLRQPSLFAGKRFSKEGKLEAADAAIVSFFYPYDSEDNEKWTERAYSLTQLSRWDVYLPHDGQSIRAYEYRLSAISRKDDVVLALAYFVMMSRIISSLRKVQAIRSRYVLLPAIVMQNCLSIMSTFAAMSLLGMNYSKIPLEAYVFIVSMIGFDNALRLINAVLVAPTEESTNVRVSRALGSISIHMLAPLERVLFLWPLSKVVSPLIASYCSFIAIAHVFDMFYHLAFFLPILCIDLQRLELQESITRQKPVSLSRSPIQTNADISDVDSLQKLHTRKTKSHGNVRIAGTAVMLCFLLALDWQCCSNQTVPHVIRKTIAFLFYNSSNTTTDFWSELMRTVRPSRSLTSWLYLQNQDTAKEILRVMKPSAPEFEAVIYDPLVIVLKGANRSGALGKSEIPSISLETLTLSQLILSTTLVATGIMITWMALRIWAPSQFYRSFPASSSLNALAFQEHDMDIITMATSRKGSLITISLDREVFLWRLETPEILTLTHSFVLENEHWPVVVVSISDDGKWAAFCNYKGVINIWNCERRTFESPIMIQPPFSPASKFFYMSTDSKPNSMDLPRMAIVRPSGWLSEITPRKGEIVHHRIGNAPVLSAIAMTISQPYFSILSLSKDKNVYITSKVSAAWYSQKLEIKKRPAASLSSITIVTFPGLDTIYALLSASPKIACIINSETQTVIHSFRIMTFSPTTARGLFTSSHLCSACGAVSVSSIAIAYTDPETKSLIMHTFVQSCASHDGVNKICLGRLQNPQDDNKADKQPCPAFESAAEHLHVIEDVSTWEQLDSQNLTGIREKTTRKQPLVSGSRPRSSDIRRKGGSRTSGSLPSLDDDWEAWMMNITGQSMSCNVDHTGQRTRLAVSAVGPAQKIGPRSVAVAFGNSVVVLSAGEEERMTRIGGKRKIY